ncbi:hypothetical protein [uncultured Roseivirga sp.]|uniref:hypothetical protein n=1 Tax=uncultured Roseivirga sp. TaxID=543088 RepID=UPI0030DCDDBC|tara:strand:+ start:1324 stop:1527 length:204 start_codon:yes stop_codon:yes gene_type:complete
MTTETKSNQPSHFVYRVDGQGAQAKWTKVGAVWPTKSGYTQILNGLEKDLRFVIQEVRQDEPHYEAE